MHTYIALVLYIYVNIYEHGWNEVSVRFTTPQIAHIPVSLHQASKSLSLQGGPVESFGLRMA